MEVALMLTCLCDAYYVEVGVATLRVLERVECQVCFDQDQTCCGQPAFNAGDWGEARAIAGHSRDVFSSRAYWFGASTGRVNFWFT